MECTAKASKKEKGHVADLLSGIDLGAMREDAKLNEVSVLLCRLLDHTNTTRSEVAERLNWKPSRVTKVLSGDDNLTLRTIVRFLSAVGYDFDLVFRQVSDKRARQIWEKPQLSLVFDAHESLRRHSHSAPPACHSRSFRFKPIVRNAGVGANDANVKSHEAVAA